MNNRKTFDTLSIQPVKIGIAPYTLSAFITMPENCCGMVIIPCRASDDPHCSDFKGVAMVLNKYGLGTLVANMTNVTERDPGDFALSERLQSASHWLEQHQATRDLPFGYYASNSAASIALNTVVRTDNQAKSMVVRSGNLNPDWAGFSSLKIPTLLIVGGRDADMISLNKQTIAKLRCKSSLHIIPRASYKFEEIGALEEAAQLTALWFTDHLS